MGAPIGQILPLALGIAISPLPIIAAILMLLSERAKSTSLGLLFGWVLGIVVAITAFTLLSDLIPGNDGRSSSPVVAVLHIVLGALLLLVAARQWRGRPKDGEEPTMPKWMAAIDTMSFGSAFGLGLLLSAVNPKNLLLGMAAGLAVGSAQLPVGQTALVILVFTLLAACTVLVPVVGYLIASSRLRGPLDRLRLWLTRENAVIMAVLLLVFGVDLIGKGIAGF